MHFIDCMLNMIENAMYKFIDIATETITVEDSPANDPEHGPEHDPDRDPDNLMLTLMKHDPLITYEKLAKATGKSTAYVKRHIRAMKEEGLIERIGPDRGGHWVVKQA